MIIDADTHIAPQDRPDMLARGIESFLPEAAIEAMDRCGVDRSLVWLSPHHYKGKEIADHNRFVYEQAKKHPDRFLPFGWTDPTVGVEHAKDMVKLCTEELGFPGVKMNGADNNFFIDDPKIAMPVVEEIARSGKMIAFHIGPDGYEKTHPFRAARIAKMYPEMTVLMIHMGKGHNDMTRAVLEMARECPNMVLVASATTDRAALGAIRALGASRVCFGSDRPFRKMKVIKAMFEAGLEDEISEKEMGAFMGGNMARLFGA